MSVEEKIRAFFNRIKKLDSTRKAFHSECAKSYILPENIPEWMANVEQSAKSLTDEIPQKHRILHYIKLINIAFENNNQSDLKSYVYAVHIEIEDARLNEIVINGNEVKAKQKLDGKNSGSKVKVRLWAKEIAKELLSNKYKTQNEAWKALPSSHEPFECETDKASYEVYVDGDNIYGVNTLNNKEQKLTRETFFKQYYRKVKKIGK